MVPATKWTSQDTQDTLNLLRTTLVMKLQGPCQCRPVEWGPAPACARCTDVDSLERLIRSYAAR